MAWKPILFSLVLLFAKALPVPAQGAGNGAAGAEVRSILDKEEVSLADLFRVAELANPTLAAARNGVEAKAGLTRQAGLYPNPAVEFEIEELSTSNPDDRKEKVSFVQPVILSGRRGAAVAAARSEQEAAAQTFLNVRRDVYRRIHTLWAEQLYFREADEAVEELLRLANRTLSIARARFEARAAPESQVTRALLEVYELEVVQQELAKQQASGSAALSALLGGGHIPFDRFAGSLEAESDSTIELLRSVDVDEHPAVQAARRETDAARASLREARAARIPDLDVFVAYGRYRAIDAGFVEAGVSVPLPIFDRNQGQIAELRSSIAQGEDRARTVHNDLEVAFEVARRRYHTTRDQLQDLRNRIMPAAERGLEQAQEGYRVGRLPFLELIDAQRTLSDVRLRILELRKDLIVAEAELMSLVGAGPYDEGGK